MLYVNFTSIYKKKKTQPQTIDISSFVLAVTIRLLK